MRTSTCLAVGVCGWVTSLSRNANNVCEPPIFGVDVQIFRGIRTAIDPEDVMGPTRGFKF